MILSVPRAALALTLVLATASTAVALNPSRTYKQRPEKYNMKYVAKDVKTNDGAATLKVWDFAPRKAGSPVVLVAHSGEGNMADYLRRADGLLGLGYGVVMFDYRGFGESSEFEIDANMAIYPHFLDDVATMFDYTRKAHAANFDVYGWGIGGGLALGVGWGRPETRRIVADTPFLSMEDLENRFSSMDEPPEVPFAGFDKRFEPATALAETAPGRNLQSVTLIIGSADRLFRKADMEGLRAKQKKLVKAVYVVENPDRKDNFRVNTAGYLGAIGAAAGAPVKK